ncbi:hypothetical protein LUZ60_010109 [Juncus effusus]|nr:hypothetical protein LUZ60_010109 [Juncus effusus]
MEKFVVPSTFPENSRRNRIRGRWTRCIAELEGRLSSEYRHRSSQLLLNSYYQSRVFEHSTTGDGDCPTHRAPFLSVNNPEIQFFASRKWVSAVEFDSKGIYIASATKSGCITVHDFETLYCSIHGPTSSLRNYKGKPVIHIATLMPLDAIKWNPSNQDEIACASRLKDKILLFDIGYESCDPIEVLHKGKSKFSALNYESQTGLSDIIFPSDDKSRLLASSLDGGILMWDRRSSKTHCLEIRARSSHCKINSIELDKDNRVVLGASRDGVIYAWDLRGGRSSFAFQNPNEVPVLTSMKVSSMLEKIQPLKEQSNIVAREISSIKFDPSCSYQLAFHLDDGWSGVINVNDLSVTHVHCPPPDWLESTGISTFSSIKRPAWLPTSSVYAVGCLSRKGMYLLDFHPDKTSPCHVHFNDEIENIGDENRRAVQNKFISVSEEIISCAAHPLNGTVIAGTKESSLMVISPKSANDEGSE